MYANVNVAWFLSLLQHGSILHSRLHLKMMVLVVAVLNDSPPSGLTFLLRHATFFETDWEAFYSTYYNTFYILLPEGFIVNSLGLSKQKSLFVHRL